MWFLKLDGRESVLSLYLHIMSLTKLYEVDRGNLWSFEKAS